MSNPLQLGVIKTRIPKSPDKLRALSLKVNVYNFTKQDKKISKDRNYLLDGKVKLHRIGTIAPDGRIVKCIELPIKYTKSGVMGLNDPVIYKSIFINLLLSEKNEKKLLKVIKKLNKFRKAADIEYFNRFTNNSVKMNFYIVIKDGYTTVKKLVIDGPTKELDLTMTF